MIVIPLLMSASSSFEWLDYLNRVLEKVMLFVLCFVICDNQKLSQSSENSGGVFSLTEKWNMYPHDLKLLA